MKFNVTAGVIDSSRMNSFERILWRISKGNVFLKQSDMTEDLIDPVTGDQVRKSIFLLFFQGEELKSRVKKVCEGYHASIYPCPESLVERREMLAGVEVRLEDLDRVLRETNDHRHGFLTDKVTSLNKWVIQVNMYLISAFIFVLLHSQFLIISFKLLNDEILLKKVSWLLINFFY